MFMPTVCIEDSKVCEEVDTFCGPWGCSLTSRDMEKGTHDMEDGEWPLATLFYCLGFTRPHSVVTPRIVEMPTAGEQPDDGDEQRGRLPALNSASGGHHSQERAGNQVPRSGQSSVSSLRALEPL